jgi:hypothetical protein
MLNYETDKAFAHSDGFQHVELGMFIKIKTICIEELLMLRSRSCKMQLNFAGLICDSDCEDGPKKKELELCQYLGHDGTDCPILLTNFLNYVKQN